MNRRDFLHLTSLAVVGATVASTGARASKASRAGAGARDLTATDYRATRQFAQTAFGRIAYVERGVGRPALFLHGFPLNGFQWRGALPRLAPYRRCIAPDFLAMGYSDVAEGQGVDPHAQVAMIVGLLDALGLDSADVVANDSGGAVAQLLLAQHPERVRTLLLTNCDAENDSPPPALLPVIELSKQGRFVDEWLATWQADKVRARSAEGIGGMCFADPAHPTDEAIDMYFAPLIASPRRKALVHAYAIALEANPLDGIAPRLARSDVPVRIVWAMGDTIFSPASAAYLDKAFGNSRGVRRLGRGKLFWPEEQPDVVAEEAKRLWGV